MLSFPTGHLTSTVIMKKSNQKQTGGSRGAFYFPEAFILELITRLFSWVESDSLRRRIQIADFAKLAACLYPDALEEECLMMSYYHLWVPLYVFFPNVFSYTFIFSLGIPLG
jgi:hypothetical protein